MTYSCRCFCIFLVVLETINLLSGRPQHSETHFDYDLNRNNGSNAGELFSRRFTRHTTNAKTNKTKEERILNTSNRRGTVSFGENSEQDIIFPDSFELVFEPIPRIDGAPKCANGSTFCENFDSYPYLHMKDILRTSPPVNKEFFFGEDEMPTQLEERVGGIDESFICGAVDRIIFPKLGKNKKNEWKYIVNQDKTEGYVQGVRTETCRHEGQACDIIGELPEGFRTSCKQKYIYRRLLSLNQNGTPEPDTFQLPSACCCSYKRDLGFLTRFGKAVTPKSTKGTSHNTGQVNN